MTKQLRDKPNHWSEAVGEPDDWDKKNIRALIDRFYQRKFTIEGQKINGKQLINLCVAEAKRSHGLDGHNALQNKFGIKSKESDLRIRLTLPIVLEREISLAYPAMFKDDAQHEWFIKNFPEFRII